MYIIIRPYIYIGTQQNLIYINKIQITFVSSIHTKINKTKYTHDKSRQTMECPTSRSCEITLLNIKRTGFKNRSDNTKFKVSFQNSTKRIVREQASTRSPSLRNVTAPCYKVWVRVESVCVCLRLDCGEITEAHWLREAQVDGKSLMRWRSWTTAQRSAPMWTKERDGEVREWDKREWRV